MLQSLDFVYVPTGDVDAAARSYVDYRVADYESAVARLRAAGAQELRELEIPHGPCASFRAPGGQRFAVYELTRPGAGEHFAGRIDE